MKPLLLLALLLPLFAFAQTVQPVLSEDYLRLIKNGKPAAKEPLSADTVINVQAQRLKLAYSYSGYAIGKMNVQNGTLRISPPVYRMLALSGQFSQTLEWKSVNRLPSVQTAFAQGRTVNGSLVWRGPETNEMFSFGPLLSSLQFDGSNYAYDNSGRLVPVGSGNGMAAAYQNNIFRTALMQGQTLHLQGRYYNGNKTYTGWVRAGRSAENLVVQQNKNTGHNLSAGGETTFGYLVLSGRFSVASQNLSAANRNGFLNRVYQQSMLTPSSFDNSQGYSLDGRQRSYSTAADNPLFLLKTATNSLQQTAQSAVIALENRGGRLRYKLQPSFENLRSKGLESYATGTVNFPNGYFLPRHTSTKDFYLKGDANYNINNSWDGFSHRLSAAYTLAQRQAGIEYNSAPNYYYQRGSHDMATSYEASYRRSSSEVNLQVANKMYASNTATKAHFFLPTITASAKWNDVVWDGVDVKIFGSYHQYATETSISRSFAANTLLQHTTEEMRSWTPALEVSTYNGLAPVLNKQSSARVEIGYKNRFFLKGEWFNQLTENDVFPLYNNGLLRLQNLASHQNRGMEIELEANTYSRNFSSGHSLSFFRNRSKVLEVKDGYNYTPLAGFSTVHKALLKGEVVGAIVGSRFLRDTKGSKIIDGDGFPIVASQPGVIGNPLPDFTLKMSHSLNWKRFAFNLDCEWRKGGEVWNGTAGLLDYYGRSQTSASQRYTTGYVFEGVSQSGHPNNVPVDFYNPSQPFESNRWVRYGFGGVAEDYIQKADAVRINRVGFSYKIFTHKYLQSIQLTAYAANLLLWTAYKGADPASLLNDIDGTDGLDFFNLPSTKTIGCSLSIQF